MTAEKKILFSHGITSETINLDSKISQAKAMRIQRKYAPTISMGNCGRKLIPNISPVLYITNSFARFSGTQSCNSQWCPNCMGYSRQKRIDEVNQGIEGAELSNKPTYFFTSTIPRSYDARTQARHLSYGWKCLLDKCNYRLNRQDNKMYFVRSHDVTFRIEQREIYHQHLHNIIVLDKPFQSFTEYRRRNSEDMGYFIKNGFTFNHKNKLIIPTFETFLMVAWYDINQKKDIKISFDAQDVQHVRPGKESRNQLSQYLLKFWSMGQEMACFAHKEGKHGKLRNTYESIGFMQLMGWIEKGNKRAIQIYREFLMAMYNHRTLGKSQNWKELISLAAADEKEEAEEIPEIIISFSHEWFYLIQKTNDAYKGFCATDAFLLACSYLYNSDKVDAIDNLFKKPPEVGRLKKFLVLYCPL